MAGLTETILEGEATNFMSRATIDGKDVMLSPGVSVSGAVDELIKHIKGMTEGILILQERIKLLEEEIKRLKPESPVDTVGNLIIEKEDK